MKDGKKMQVCLWSRSGYLAAQAMHAKQPGVVPVRQKLVLLIFPFQLREVCLSWIKKKKKMRKVKGARYLGKYWKERVPAQAVCARVWAGTYVQVHGWTSFFPLHSESGLKGHCPRSPPRTWPSGNGLAFLSWEARLFAWAEPDESSTTRLLLCLRPFFLKEPTPLFLFGTYSWFEKTWLKGKPST